MKIYRPEMISKLIEKYIRYAIQFNNNMLYIHRYKYNSQLLSKDIVITKVLPGKAIRSINVYYYINGNDVDKSFISENKRTILIFLKKKIKMRKFPMIKFHYDNNYSHKIYDIIRNLP